jgi:hypothetical protein
VQEVVLARSVNVFCGKSVMSWDSIALFALWLEKADWLSSTTATVKLDRLYHNLVRITELGFLRTRLQSSSEHWSWYLWYGTTVGRRRDASVPDDKIYGILGILNRVIGEDSDKLPFQTTYRSNLQELYKKATLLLYKEWSLNSISSAQSYFSQKISGLPSWAINFNDQEASLQVAHIDGFKASGNETSSFLELNNELYLTGIPVGQIYMIKTQSDFKWSLSQSLLEFFSPSDESKPLPTTLADTLWRSFILDSDYNDTAPAPEGWRNHFTDFVTYSIMFDIWDGELHRSETSQEILARWNKIVTILFRGDEQEFLPLEKIIQQCSLHALKPKDEQKAAILNLHQSLASGYLERNMKIINAHFFRISSGHFGLGSKFAALGDELWIVNGVRSPLILRRKEEGKYILVGDGYVHGAMYGEMAERLQSLRQILILI